MKKLILLAVMMSLGIAAQAQTLYTRSSDTRVKTYTLTKDSNATLASAITTNNRIIGYTFNDSAAGEAALFDCSVAIGASALDVPSTSNVFAEPMVIAGGLVTTMFPMPRNVTKGLVVKMSTATGAVTVYYE